jgi:hypothetical protein
MTETPTDFVDIPGMPAVAWDSTLPPPTRRIQLPIQMRLSRRVRFAWLWMILCISVAAILLTGLSIEATAYFRGELCLGKHGVSSRAECGFSASLCLACLLFVLFVIMRVAGYIALGRHIHKSPSFQLDVKRETFWHFQLCEPLPFEDIVEVTAVKMRGDIDSIALRCRIPPRLAFWTFSNRLLWSGKDATFTFVPGAFLPATLPKGNLTYAVLLDVINALTKLAVAGTL